MDIRQPWTAAIDSCAVNAVHPDRVGRAHRALLSDQVYTSLAETFRALGDPSRAKIVYSLEQVELCVCDLAAVVGMSDSAVSQHLRVLRALRLVKVRRDGKNVYYSLDDGHIRTLLQVCLNHVGHGEEQSAALPAPPGEGPAAE